MKTHHVGFYVVLILGILCGFFSGRPGTAQQCPPDGTLVNGSLDSGGPTMPERLFRDGVPSVCNPPKAFPGTFLGLNLFETFAFRNLWGQACMNATLNTGTCGTAVHLMAYLDSFDPNNLQTNYLGDVGSSVSQSFSFVVPAGETFVMVAQSNFGPTTCDYSFTLSGANCAPGAPVFSRWGSAASVILLLMVGAFALRRGAARKTLLGIGVLIVLVLALPRFGGTADNRQCMTACSESFKSCAENQCGSGAADNDPQCVERCRAAYEACVAACSQ